jgi:hypothetical protein
MIREGLTTTTTKEMVAAHISSQVGVGVESGAGHVELSGKVFDFVDEADDRLELLVGLRKGGLELGVGVDQTLKSGKHVLALGQLKAD